MKVGDRVRLTGSSCGNAVYGSEGTVTYIPKKAHWIAVKFDCDPNERTPAIARLEKITMPKTIDTTKPLEFVNAAGSTFDVQFITMTSEGHILVEGNDYWRIFDVNGKFVRDKDGVAKTVELRNKVETKTLFLRVSAACPHDALSLHRTLPGGHGVAVIEVQIKDGILTDAKVVRENQPGHEFDKVMLANKLEVEEL